MHKRYKPFHFYVIQDLWNNIPAQERESHVTFSWKALYKVLFVHKCFYQTTALYTACCETYVHIWHQLIMPYIAFKFLINQTSWYERHSGTCSDQVPSTRHCGQPASNFATYPVAHVTFRWSPGSYENLTGAILPCCGSPGYGHRALPVTKMWSNGNY